MLKILFIDVNPYVIDAKQLNDVVWNNLSKNKIIDKYLGIEPALEKYFEKHKSLFNCQDEYLKLLDSKDYQDLVNQWNTFYLIALENYLTKNGLPQTFINLFNDTAQNNIELVLVTNNNNFVDIAKQIKSLCKLNITLLKLDHFETLEIDTLLDYASEENASYDQIAVITQQTDCIDNLVKNNILTFSVGMNQLGSFENFVSLDNYSSVNLEEILYHYYEYNKKNNIGI